MHDADVQSLNAAGFEVQEVHETAGGRSTSGVVEPPIPHGAALVWAGDVRVDPDPLVLRGMPRGDCWRALDIRCRRAAHRTRRRPGLGRRCAGGSRRGAEVRDVGIQSLNAAGFEVHEVHDADVQNLNAAGFEGQEVHDADDQNLDAIGFEVQKVHDVDVQNLNAADVQNLDAVQGYRPCG